MDELLLSAGTLSAIVALFVSLMYLVRKEQLVGRRLCALWVRDRLDRVVGYFSGGARQAVTTVKDHRLERQQRTTDPSVANAVFRHATRTPLTVTYSDNHLSKMHDHKIDTALTAAEKTKRKKQKLEERF